MFAAPNPDAARDVEAHPAAAYPQQDPTIIQKTTITTTSTGPQQPAYGGNVQPGMMMGPTAPQQAASTANAATVPKSSIGRMAASIHWGTFMLLIAFFSMQTMIASAQICDVNMPNGSCVATRGYQVSAGVISLVLSLFFGLLHKCGSFTHEGGMSAISAFLFLWWIAGVIVFTFFGDFQSTQRAAGYFSAWGAFILSMLSLVHISDSFEYGLDKTLHSVRKPIFFLAIASLVTMGAAIGPCSATCSGYNGWAIVASVVSLFISIVLFCFPVRLERSLLRWVAYFMVLWWVFAASTLTLGGPFLVAGNGFFGAYAALLASAWFVAMVNSSLDSPAT